MPEDRYFVSLIFVASSQFDESNLLLQFVLMLRCYTTSGYGKGLIFHKHALPEQLHMCLFQVCILFSCRWHCWWYHNQKVTASAFIAFMLFLLVRDCMNGMNTYVAKHIVFFISSYLFQSSKVFGCCSMDILSLIYI